MRDATVRLIIAALSILLILLGAATFDLATTPASQVFGAVVLVIGALGIAEAMRSHP